MRPLENLESTSFFRLENGSCFEESGQGKRSAGSGATSETWLAAGSRTSRRALLARVQGRWTLFCAIVLQTHGVPCPIRGEARGERSHRHQKRRAGPSSIQTVFFDNQEDGKKLLAAVSHFLLALQRWTPVSFPRVESALNGWRRHTQVRRRPPVP